MMLQRSGWLDHPEEHLPQLKKVFVTGMIVNVLSSLPVALVALGAWEPPRPCRRPRSYLTLLGGMYAGIGYICGFALLAHKLRGVGRRGVPGALAAVGERSLTCYLLQSIIMAPAAHRLGPGPRRGHRLPDRVRLRVRHLAGHRRSSRSLLDKAGKRGPFEVLLRRLTYGRKPA